MSEKEEAELAFWESRLAQQGTLANDHFEHFFTTHFGLDRAFYRGKRLLDIGCGPRGSLEWAGDTARRVGVDPLAEAYVRRLGADRHAMEYVACGAERLPFAEGAFDVVSSFNSLDHVDDLDRVIGEIGRVLAPGGTLLLLTDIHLRPTTLEPMAFSWDIVERIPLEPIEVRHLEYSAFTPEGFGNIYGSLTNGVPYDHDDPRERTGILSARFRKND